MRPNFALKLSHDGIGLLLRATGGWRVVGEVSLDDPDLATTLRYLRRTATEMAGGQFATKLIIPNSQILFRDVFAPGDTPGARRVAIRAALDGTTPYALDDLAFDWSDAGDGMAKVAVIASLTLEEAEAFATEHRFNPVSFVAAPQTGDFLGEPWFGTTRLAKGLLAGDETVERDTEAVTIIGPAQITEEPLDPETLAEQAGNIFVDADEPAEPAGDIPWAQAEMAGPEPAEAVDPEPDRPAITFSTRRAGEVADLAANGPAKPTGSAGDAPQAPADVDRSEPSNASDPQPDALAVAFSTSRAGEVADLAPLRLENITPRIAIQPGGAPSTKNDSLPLLGGASRNVEVTHLSVTAPDIVGDEQEITPLVTAKTASRTALKLNAAPSSVAAKPPFPPTAAEEPARPSLTIARETTVFGARKPARPRRRYLGLILTLALIAALLAAGLLSNLVLGDETVLSRLFGPSEPAETETISKVAPPEAGPTESGATAETGISLQEAVAIHSETGLWPFAPTAPIDPDSDQIDDLYIASIDPVVVSHDAVALPGVDLALPDAELQAMTSPTPEGTTFDLDEDGLVRALPDGALTPDGVMVFAGKPSRIPAARPDVIHEDNVHRLRTKLVAGFRPRARPDNLAEENQKARLGGRTLSQLAAIRPAPRPASAQDSDAAVDETPTKLAVLNSPSPASRPTDFSRIVEKAVAEAQASAPDESEEGEEAEDEPVLTSAATVAAPKLPAVPTRASVAKEATVKNAINLGKINLIGVYGSSSNRRALIRLSSGKYVKVQVGDRIDGGQVAAIGSSEVLYVKRGRKVTLAMPKG